MFDKDFWPIQVIFLVSMAALVVTAVKMIFTEAPLLAIIAIVVVLGIAKLFKK